jgi:hypothetical protein
VLAVRQSRPDQPDCESAPLDRLGDGAVSETPRADAAVAIDRKAGPLSMSEVVSHALPMPRPGTLRPMGAGAIRAECSGQVGDEWRSVGGEPWVGQDQNVARTAGAQVILWCSRPGEGRGCLSPGAARHDRLRCVRAR